MRRVDDVYSSLVCPRTGQLVTSLGVDRTQPFRTNLMFLHMKSIKHARSGREGTERRRQGGNDAQHRLTCCKVANHISTPV